MGSRSGQKCADEVAKKCPQECYDAQQFTPGDDFESEICKER